MRYTKPSMQISMNRNAKNIIMKIYAKGTSNQNVGPNNIKYWQKKGK